jgi:hypothetical protein
VPGIVDDEDEQAIQTEPVDRRARKPDMADVWRVERTSEDP